MAQYDKELSNLSYINKDFNAIYPELLDLVTKISYKWDPTVSDESDPGVVLLKLAALMADKLNYNIDKNILELFPVSVTQLDNARQIFDQCGYTMKYYQSASVDVSITLVSEPEINDESAEKLGLDIKDKDNKINNRVYRIPRFTMVSSSDNNYVYTLTDEVNIESDRKTVVAKALQGIATQYTINGETLVSAENLDYNRRLYFTDMDIAENGIFIKNNLFGYSEWKAVDNLLVQPINTPCYKFGLTYDGRTCYIEFPTDIDSMIGDGLEITYIRTNGVDGNIGKKFLTQLFKDTNAVRYLARNGASSNFSEEVQITMDNLYITNTFAANNGKNPESIEDAYINYTKVKNTFDTLVSLMDYNNFIISNNMVSNGFVCDRTNDVQSSHKVISTTSDGTVTNTFVSNKETIYENVDGKNYKSGKHTKDTDGKIISTEWNEDIDVIKVNEPSLTAFDLKFYGLQYTGDPTSATGYTTSFTPIELVVSSATNENRIANDPFNNIKCIQHDLATIDTDKIVMLKNKYPIVVKVIPQYKITNLQQMEMISKIYYALYATLNSQEISFGEEISYDAIYDAIIASDPRIKAIMLNNIEYETYAVYLHQYLTDKGTLKREFREVRIDSESTQPDEYLITTDKTNNKTKDYYTKDGDTYTKVDKEITFDSGVIYYEKNIEYDLWEKFRAEIYAKNVLCGATQLFESDNRFTYSLKQQGFTVYEDIYKVNTNVDIKVDNHKFTSVKTNENVVFTCPNLIDDMSYSSYTKFFYNLKHDIKKDSDYRLHDDEFIVMFWKTGDSDTDPYLYAKYSANSEINIIQPSMDIKANAQTDRENTFPNNGNTYKLDIEVFRLLDDGNGSTDQRTVLAENKESVKERVGMTAYVQGFIGSTYVLTGSNGIKTRQINKVYVNNSVNGTRSVFWILNRTINGEDGLNYYRLFDENTYNELTKEHEYTLQSGEYFMYSNEAKTHLVMLGQGTKITANNVVVSELNRKLEQLKINDPSNTTEIENAESALSNEETPWKNSTRKR
jgi:hypothetical protein